MLVEAAWAAGSVTAVGMYPTDASSTGALDMVGTVRSGACKGSRDCKVTRSSARDFDFRVLRGGPWLDYRV